jgi:hypothetical protein
MAVHHLDPQPPRQNLRCLLKQYLWRVLPPADFIQLAAEVHVIVDAVLAKLLQHMVAEIEHRNPAVFAFLVPFFVITVVAGVEVQYVFTDQNKFRNALLHHQLRHLTLQEHDVVVDGIVPFTDHLDDGETLFIVCKENLDVQGLRSETVPLRMNQVVVHLVREHELTVFPFIKGTPFVFAGIVEVLPEIVWLDRVHTAKLRAGAACLS